MRQHTLTATAGAVLLLIGGTATAQTPPPDTNA